MTSIWLVAGVILLALFVGILLMANLFQWIRFRSRESYWEGRIQSIGRQLIHLPKRKSDRQEP
jgi:hypothetical protein